MEAELMLATDDSTTIMTILKEIHNCVEETLVNLQKSFGVKLSRETMMKPQPGRRQRERRSFVRDVLSMVEKHGSTRISQHVLEKSKAQCGKHSPHALVPESDIQNSTQDVKKISSEFGLTHDQSPNQDTSFRKNYVPLAPEDASEAQKGPFGAGRSNRLDIVLPQPTLNTPKMAPERRTERSSHHKDKADERTPNSSPGFAVIRHIPSTVRMSLGAEMEASNPVLNELNNENIEQCEDMVDSIMNMLGLITRTGHIIDKAFVLSMRDSKGEIEILQEKLSIRNEKIEELEKELYTQTNEMEIARNDMEDLGERVKSMTEAILKHEDLGYEVKRLEEEKEEWNIQEQKLTREIILLSQQMEELVSNAVDGRWETKDGACLKEIMALKKRNRQLECQIYGETQRGKQLESKLMRRLKITDQNWQKAETEAKDLDNIIQAIRKICIDNRSTRQSPVFLHIIDLIDGQTDSVLGNSNACAD